MSDPTLKDYKLRLIIFNEWKLKSSVDETVEIINKRLGKDYIDSTKVQEWFDKFNEGDTLIFDDSPLNVSIQNNSMKSIDSLLFLSDEKCDQFKILKCNGRFIEYYYYYSFENKEFIVRHDLFLNVKREIELPFNVVKFAMISDDGFLLAYDDHKRKMHLIKLDYENFNANLLDSIKCDGYVYGILVDQLNSSKFLIDMDGKKFAMGKVKDGKIVLDDFGNHIDIDFKARRLVAKKLQGFGWNSKFKSMSFCEFNLGTMERRNVNVPFDLGNQSLSIKVFRDYPYCWSENRFYGMFKMSDNQWHILMFNSDELKWTNIQIGTKSPLNLHVDSNEVLSLSVGSLYETTAFYRVNLRKPEKLETLAHLAILRQSTLFGNDKYLERVEKLPIKFVKMVGSIFDEYKLRFMLLNEWKSETSVDETVKIIQSKMGKEWADSTKVQEWFNKFNKGDISIFGKDSKLHVSIQENPNDPLNSLLLLMDKNQTSFTFLKCNERFIEYHYRFGDKRFIVRHDLFLNVKREIEMCFITIWDSVIIDDEILLVFNNEKRTLDLIKLDYENLTTNLLDSIDFNRYVRFIYADQQNPHKCVVFVHKDNITWDEIQNLLYTMVEIRDEKIILGDFKDFGDVYYYGKRLMDSKLHGFDYNRGLFKFFEMDLDTTQRNEVNVPIDLEIEPLHALDYNSNSYCWSKNRFYGAFEMSDRQYNVLMFDLDVMKWSNIQIMTNEPRNLFVDSNENLILKVGKHARVNALYRLNLRKPNKLENLAHLEALRQSTLFGNDKFLRSIKRLPIQR